MHFIQTHKKESILIFMSILILLCLLLFFKIFFFSGSKNVYGDRLSDIESVKISKDKMEIIENELVSSEEIEKASLYVTGRVIHFFLEVKMDASLDAMKNLALRGTENFSEKEKELYDIQIYVVGEGENYPAIGYQGKGGAEFTWVNS